MLVSGRSALYSSDVLWLIGAFDDCNTITAAQGGREEQVEVEDGSHGGPHDGPHPEDPV